MIKKFEKKFKEIKVVGNRKNAVVLYSESNCVPDTYYTESELEKIYMGMKNKARKRFKR